AFGHPSLVGEGSGDQRGAWLRRVSGSPLPVGEGLEVRSGANGNTLNGIAIRCVCACVLLLTSPGARDTVRHIIASVARILCERKNWMTAEHTEHVDILIVGAGLSGIAAAYYVQKRCPTKT